MNTEKKYWDDFVAGAGVAPEEKYENIILMGDSAGGGFVLSFCQYLKQIKVKQPNNIIVFSPWVDLSMENCVDDGDDPILGKVGLVEISLIIFFFFIKRFLLSLKLKLSLNLILFLLLTFSSVLEYLFP